MTTPDLSLACCWGSDLKFGCKSNLAGVERRAPMMTSLSRDVEATLELKSGPAAAPITKGLDRCSVGEYPKKCD